MMNLQSVDAIPAISIGWNQAVTEMKSSASIMNMVMDAQVDLLSTLLQGVDASTQAMQLLANPNVGSLFDVSV